MQKFRKLEVVCVNFNSFFYLLESDTLNELIKFECLLMTLYCMHQSKKFERSK